MTDVELSIIISVYNRNDRRMINCLRSLIRQNTQHHYDKHDDHSFKFIGSTPKTIKKMGDLLIALSEIK